MSDRISNELTELTTFDRPVAAIVTSGERDRGMTLIELLVSMMVLGTILTVLAASMVLVFRQQPETLARADVARWEQALALWLPDDLSSASGVSNDKSDGCPAPGCSFGSNALLLTWNDGSGSPSGASTVSYRYGPSGDGETYELRRFKCTGGLPCSSNTVLGDLAGPVDVDGNPIAWVPGDEIPEDVVDVALPLQVDSTLPTGAEDTTTYGAKRVTVSVNGAPGIDGVDRSSSLTFTAGGSGRGTIAPPTFSGPQFLAADSGCGGPVTLIVDKSGSVGPAITRVREGVKSFVRNFDGTPTRLQVVLFSDEASVLGGSGWNKYYDLSDPGQVTELIGLANGITAGGTTNWEDALFRTFYAQNGLSYADYGHPDSPPPELVVFFTDGKPTFDRSNQFTGDPGTVAANPGGIWQYTDTTNSGTSGSALSPRAWKRSANILENFRDVRMIGVGVGTAFKDTALTDDRSRMVLPGWPNPAQDYLHEVFLGSLMSGEPDPSAYPLGTPGNYVVREYHSATGWGDVDTADLLITNDFSRFGDALTEIALGECGGSLTVQTRDGAGARVDETVTYRVEGETVSTSKFSPSGTFDIATSGGLPRTVDLVPEPLDGSGLVATGWNCQARGVDVPGAWSLLDGSNPSAGISVTVSADEAMSCTMQVA